MRKTLLLFSIALLTSIFMRAQEIEMKMTFWGYKFEKNDERLSWKELLKETESRSESFKLIKKARKQRTVSTILIPISGFLTGIPIGQATNNVDPNWSLAYVGAGLAAIAIPLSLSTFNNVNKGVDSYNLANKTISRTQFKPELYVLANNKGIGFSVQF